MTSTASRAAVEPRFAGRETQLWATTVLRVLLGLVMVAAGVLKVSNPDEAVRAVQAYQILPSSVDQFVGYALPLLEIVLGILLLIGLGTRVAAVLAGFFMVVFIVAVSSAWIRGLSIDCGCFGGGGTVSEVGKAWRYTSEILRDLLLAGMASFIAVFPASRFAVDGSGRVGTGDLGLLDELDDDDLDDEIDGLDGLDDSSDPDSSSGPDPEENQR